MVFLTITKEIKCILFYPCLKSPQWIRASSLSRHHYYTQTHYTSQQSSGQAISPTYRPLPDNTHHSEEGTWRIRIYNLSKRVAPHTHSLERAATKIGVYEYQLPLILQQSRLMPPSVIWMYCRKLYIPTCTRF